MIDMKDREDGFERKFVWDEELRFKAIARRNRALGLWAAQRIGKTGQDAEIYAREVVLADMQEAGDQDLLRKIQEDFKIHGIDFPDHKIQSILEEFWELAKKDVQAVES